MQPFNSNFNGLSLTNSISGSSWNKFTLHPKNFHNKGTSGHRWSELLYLSRFLGSVHYFVKIVLLYSMAFEKINIVSSTLCSSIIRILYFVPFKTWLMSLSCGKEETPAFVAVDMDCVLKVRLLRSINDPQQRGPVRIFLWVKKVTHMLSTLGCH